MAYTLRPVGLGDFELYRKFYSDSFCNEAYLVYENLKRRVDAPYPITLDPARKRSIKVSTDYSPSIIQELKDEHPNLSFKWGNGSFGNQGVNNRGIAYEKALCKIIDDALNKNIACAEASLIEHIRLVIGRSKPYRVEQIGGSNPILRVPNIIGNGLQLGTGIADIGNLVGDIAVSNSHGTVYISVKTTNRYTLTNIGGKKFFADKTQTVTDLGQRLLNMLCIKQDEFLEVFSSYGNGLVKSGYTVNPVIYPRDELSHFFASCYGFGYVSYCPNHDPISLTYEDCINRTRVSKVSVIYPDFGKVKRIIVQIDMYNASSMRVIIRNKNRGIFPDCILVETKFHNKTIS